MSTIAHQITAAIVRMIGIITLMLYLYYLPGWVLNLGGSTHTESVMADVNIGSPYNVWWEAGFWVVSLLLSLFAILKPHKLATWLLGKPLTSIEPPTEASFSYVDWQRIVLVGLGFWFVADSFPYLITGVIYLATVHGSIGTEFDMDFFGMIWRPGSYVIDTLQMLIRCLLGVFLIFGKERLLRLIQKTRH